MHLIVNALESSRCLPVEFTIPRTVAAFSSSDPPARTMPVPSASTTRACRGPVHKLWSESVQDGRPLHGKPNTGSVERIV